MTPAFETDAERALRTLPGSTAILYFPRTCVSRPSSSSLPHPILPTNLWLQSYTQGRNHIHTVAGSGVAHAHGGRWPLRAGLSRRETFFFAFFFKREMGRGGGSITRRDNKGCPQPLPCNVPLYTLPSSRDSTTTTTSSSVLGHRTRTRGPRMHRLRRRVQESKVCAPPLSVCSQPIG